MQKKILGLVVLALLLVVLGGCIAMRKNAAVKEEAAVVPPAETPNPSAEPTPLPSPSPAPTQAPASFVFGPDESFPPAPTFAPQPAQFASLVSFTSFSISSVPLLFTGYLPVISRGTGSLPARPRRWRAPYPKRDHNTRPHRADPRPRISGLSLRAPRRGSGPARRR